MSRLLVTGASGHLGRAVLRHLTTTFGVAAADIVAGSRKPEALAGVIPAGIATRRVDFDAPETLAPAFAGIERVLIISTDALGAPGLRLAQHKAAVAAAAQAGVEHVVYTSLPEADTSPILFAPDHWGTEQALAASTLAGWTVLRNHWYAENLLAAVPALAGGSWYHATGDGRISYIARDDLARAAAAALASDFAGKRTLTLSGGEAFTVAELATLVGAVLGTSISAVAVPPDALVQGMVGAGLPQPVAQLLASFDAHQAAGKFGRVSADYSALTGVTPQRLQDWLTQNAAALRAAAGL